MTSPRDSLTPDQQKLLQDVGKRWGPSALPANPAAMPPEYWSGLVASLSQRPAPTAVPQATAAPKTNQGQPLLQKLAGAVTKPITSIDDAADVVTDLPRRLPGALKIPGQIALQSHPIGLAASAYRYGWSPTWDKVLKPTLDRTEEIGQLALAPHIQAVVDIGKGKVDLNPASGVNLRLAQFKEYLRNLRDPEGGLDFRGATEAATDVGNFSPGVVGAAGLIGDPTNFIPGVALTKGPLAARKVAQVAQQGVKAGGLGAGIRAGAAQAGREAVAGIKGYPGAMAQEAADIGRLGAGVAKLPGKAGGALIRPQVAHAAGAENVSKLGWQESGLMGNKLNATPTPQQNKGAGFPHDARAEIVKAKKTPQAKERFYLYYWVSGYGSQRVPKAAAGGYKTADEAQAAAENIWRSDTTPSPTTAEQVAPAAQVPEQAPSTWREENVGGPADGPMGLRMDIGPVMDSSPVKQAEYLSVHKNAQTSVWTLTGNKDGIYINKGFRTQEEAVQHGDRLAGMNIAEQNDLKALTSDTGSQRTELQVYSAKLSDERYAAEQSERARARATRGPGFYPEKNWPEETVALVNEVKKFIGEGKMIPKELKAKIQADEFLKKWKGLTDPIPNKPPKPGAKRNIGVGRSFLNPEDMKVQVQNELGEMVDVPNFHALSESERSTLLGKGRNRSRAKQYEDALDSVAPEDIPPPQAPVMPKSIDEIPAMMEERAVAAVHQQADAIPVAQEPPSLIDVGTPEEAYQSFREKSGATVSDEHKTLLSMPPEEQAKVVEGAGKVLGETEAERVRALQSGDVIPDVPPPDIPIPTAEGIGSGSGSGDIIAGGGKGVGGRGGSKPPGGRFGHTPKHGDIKVGGYSMPSLPDVEDVFAKMLHDNTWQSIADRISKRFPSLVRVVNAAGTLNTAPVIAQGRIAIEVLRERMSRGLSPMFAQLDRIGTEDALFGIKDAQGRVAAQRIDGTPGRVYVQEVAENPSSFQLTERQRFWIDTAQEINKAPKKILEAHGQRVAEFEHSSEFFVGRIMVGKYDTAGNVVELGYVPMTDKRGLSGRAGTTKARTFDTLEEAVAAGYAPEPSYAKTLMIRSRSAGREAVNIRVGHWVGQHLKKASQGQVPDLVVESGAGSRKFGDTQLDVLLNTKREGVTLREFRLSGPQAQELRQFAESIAHEGELQRANKLVEVAASIGGNLRFAILTADLSVLAIQGLFALAGRPFALMPTYLKEGVVSLRALTNPDAVRQVRASRIDDFAQDGGFTRHPSLITDYGGLSEFTEATGGFVGRIPVIGEGFQRFGLMFDHVRDMLALSLADITDDAAKNLPDVARQEFIDAQDSMSNMMLGRLRTARLGIAADQRALEAGLLALAPQYYRATFGILTMAMEGGIRGREARKLLAKAVGAFFFLSVASNVLSGKVRGDNDKQVMAQALRSINPSSREFMSVRVPGADIRISLGGMPKAMMSMLMEMVVGEEFQTGQESYGRGITSVGGRVNNLARFGLGRQSPILGLTTDLVTGEDFMGANTRLNSPDGFRRLLTSNTLPIFLQNAIDEWDNKQLGRSMLQTGTGILGLNARDLGSQDVREWAARKFYPSADYGELDTWEKRYVNAQAAPELKRLYQRRADTQAADVTSSNIALMRTEAVSEREQKLLEHALNPTLESNALYAAWVKADEFERGQRQVFSDLFDLVFDERPENVNEGELQQAFDSWLALLKEPNPQMKEYGLKLFDQVYPLSSDVGQYIRRQTNQRRVPLVLLQRLGTYGRAKGILDSAYARYAAIYQRVKEEEGPEIAEEKANAYWDWFFMAEETEAALATMNESAPVT